MHNINLNLILEKTKILTIALVSLLIVYGFLSFQTLKLQTNKLTNKNQELASTLTKNFENFALALNTQKSENENIQSQLNSYQAQLNNLNRSPKPNNSVMPVTQVITQTEIKEIEKNQVGVTIENVGSYNVEIQTGDTAFTILQKAAQENNFTIEYEEYSFGIFVTSIGNIKPQGNQYWAFYYNGQFSMVGASAQEVSRNDSIFWQLQSF